MKRLTLLFTLFNLYLAINCAPEEESDDESDEMYEMADDTLPSLKGMFDDPPIRRFGIMRVKALPINCAGSKPIHEEIEAQLKFGVYSTDGEHHFEITLDDVKAKNDNYKQFKSYLTRNITVITGGMRTKARQFTDDLRYRIRPGAIVYINWDTRNSGFQYARMAHEAPVVGQWAGILMKQLSDDNAIDVQHMMGIGHSLGAHVIGNIGYYLSQHNLKMDHLIAMDPAKPCFEDWDKLESVKREHAQFLQVIHSNTGFFGYEKKIGHIDIYPNNGDDQTGCRGLKKQLCSHSYSVKLFILPNVKAYKAKNWQEFKDHTYWAKNNDENTIQIGLDLNWRQLREEQLSEEHTYYLHSPKISMRRRQMGARASTSKK